MLFVRRRRWENRSSRLFKQTCSSPPQSIWSVLREYDLLSSSKDVDVVGVDVVGDDGVGVDAFCVVVDGDLSMQSIQDLACKCNQSYIATSFVLTNDIAYWWIIFYISPRLCTFFSHSSSYFLTQICLPQTNIQKFSPSPKSVTVNVC